MIKKCLIVSLSLFLLVAAPSLAEEADDSLLGQPITSLIGSLDDYTIEISQPKNGKLTTAEVRYALENSELIDPTLHVVRFNAFPLQARLTLVSKKNPKHKLMIALSGLGLYDGRPVTYVFKYIFPDKKAKKEKIKTHNHFIQRTFSLRENAADVSVI